MLERFGGIITVKHIVKMFCLVTGDLGRTCSNPPLRVMGPPTWYSGSAPSSQPEKKTWTIKHVLHNDFPTFWPNQTEINWIPVQHKRIVYKD